MLELNNRADLQKLIDGNVSENLTLEYKASDALNKDSRRELVKDITAFANSAGGQIVYGIPEIDGMPQSLDNGVDRRQISAEWIDQILSSNSSPRVQGLRIIPIPLETEHHVAYVVNIPQATNFAPHQNSIDNKYYRRSENRSIPMQDYEIRDLLRRATTPDLWMDFSFEGSKTAQINFPLEGQYSRPMFLNATIGNRSSEPSLYPVIMLLIDVNFIVSPQSLGSFSEKPGAHTLGDYKVKAYSVSWITPIRMPIFAETLFNATDPPLDLRVDRMGLNNQKFGIGYQLLAPKVSTFRVFDIMHMPKGTLTISEPRLP